METHGLILPKFSRDAPTTPLKTIGTLACGKNYQILRKNLRFRLENTSQLLVTKNTGDVASSKCVLFHKHTGYALSRLKIVFYSKVKNPLINKTRFTMK